MELQRSEVKTILGVIEEEGKLKDVQRALPKRDRKTLSRALYLLRILWDKPHIARGLKLREAEGLVEDVGYDASASWVMRIARIFDELTRAEVAEPVPPTSIEHRDALRGAARQLRDQLAVPLAPLFGVTKLRAPDEVKIAGQGMQLQVSLPIERDHYLIDLKDHLPGHEVWGLLEDWRKRVEHLAFVLRSRLTEVKTMSGAKGRRLGLTNFFYVSATIKALEALTGDSWPEQHFQENERSDGTWDLLWVDPPRTWGLANVESRESLQEAQRLHEQLQKKMAGIKQVKNVADFLSDIRALRERLEGALELIAKQPFDFAGPCRFVGNARDPSARQVSRG